MEPDACLAEPTDGNEKLTLWASTRCRTCFEINLLQRCRSTVTRCGCVHLQSEEDSVAKRVFTTSTPQSLPLPGISTALSFGHHHALRTCSPCLTAEGRSNGRKLDLRMTACSPDFDSGFSVIQAPIQLLVQRSSAARGAWRPAPIQCRHFEPCHRPTTNTTCVGAYRGQVDLKQLMVERLMDQAAHELDIDPIELRRRNLLADDAFPFTSATGNTYDSGRYLHAQAPQPNSPTTKHARRSSRPQSRGDRMRLGIGVASYVEITAGGSSENMRRSLCMPTAQQLFCGYRSSWPGHATS